MAVAAQPGLHRGGIMLAEEGGSRVVSLVGRFGERPPVAWPEFLAWARTLSSSRLADALVGLEPLGEGSTYRFPANRRRHYEDLTSFPEGLVVVGDALSAFDPVYGQGMTVAAIEAVALGRELVALSDQLGRHAGAAVSRAEQRGMLAGRGACGRHLWRKGLAVAAPGAQRDVRNSKVFPQV